MALRPCHTFDLKFGVSFLSISEIARENEGFTKRLNNGNQAYVYAGYANYAFLI